MVVSNCMTSVSTILIADDDPYARRMLQSLLEAEGHSLLQVSRGDEALARAVEQLPDLILLDVMMPALDGFEVCRQIREHAQLREVPILLITSLNDRESRVRGLSFGADGFITKPFDSAELLAQVRTITRLNRYRRLLSEQARFQRLIQLSPAGIAIITADSRLLLVNPALAALLDAETADQLVGVDLLQYIQPNLIDRFRAGLEEVRNDSQRGVRVEIDLISRAGRSIPVEMSIGRFGDADGAYAQLIVHDISDRKAAEMQIQRQISQLTSLHAIGVAITASLDLHNTLEALLERISEQLHVDATSVLLVNRHTHMLDIAASRGLISAVNSAVVVRPDEGMAGVAFLTHRPVAIPNLRAEQMNNSRDRQLASVYSAYFALPLRARGEVKGVLEIMLKQPFEPDPQWWVFVEALAMQAAIAIDTAALFEQLQHAHAELTHSYDATIEGWSRALDLRDHETEGHSARVTELSLQLARRMRLQPEDLDHIRRGALLHDIGKMGVPDRILLKPGLLSTDEWEVMRLHPTHAYKWLAPIPFLHPALSIPYAHHEKWDGTGYPRGLKGEQIPLAARIFAVVDVWDALRSSRPYRSAWPEEQVVAHIRALSGTHFDPKVVETFLELLASRSND
jgi:PAS domain S-box-containing protein